MFDPAALLTASGLAGAALVVWGLVLAHWGRPAHPRRAHALRFLIVGTVLAALSRAVTLLHPAPAAGARGWTGWVAPLLVLSVTAATAWLTHLHRPSPPAGTASPTSRTNRSGHRRGQGRP
ncbi:hypothetical protein [Streptomyces mangrovisoli]|uniref:Uncharacterized protein n=1 Tax=Streptomyces mangrovisoli TaxID=1428628 RepID=A0A1J4NV08_9ACTN|nr:hypothetical protein [Streptomyces mangrovisoli]OIJ64966.1 hypothetical protein WN71_026135 [Streptomyces mangrovisoli]